MILIKKPQNYRLPGGNGDGVDEEQENTPDKN